MHIYLLKKDGTEREQQNKYLSEICPSIEKGLMLMLCEYYIVLCIIMIIHLLLWKPIKFQIL